MSEPLDQVERFKVKQLIKRLQAFKGNGTSMVTLIIRAGDQLSKYSQMLTDEYGTASNIKSKVNRLSVLAAITSAQYQLKQYSRLPANGLAIFCGTGVGPDGKEKKLNISFEPPKPLITSQYLCDSVFHTENLMCLLEDDARFGFIVVGGDEVVFAAVQGSSHEIIGGFSVDLPKKHNKGGQSAGRLFRLRHEAIDAYIKKVCEQATRTFIESDKPNVKALFIAGVADKKQVLYDSASLDPRLKAIVLKPLIDLSYGGRNGFNQALSEAAPMLGDIRVIEEKRLLGQYFERIAKDKGAYCFQIKDTMYAFELGAVETLIVWEESPLLRLEYTDSSGGSVVKYANSPPDVAGFELTKSELFVDWIAEHHKDGGAKLEMVTDTTDLGSQFCKGFGGIGGLLRWPVDFTEYGEDDDKDGFGDDGEKSGDDLDDDFW